METNPFLYSKFLYENGKKQEAFEYLDVRFQDFFGGPFIGDSKRFYIAEDQFLNTFELAVSHYLSPKNDKWLQQGLFLQPFETVFGFIFSSMYHPNVLENIFLEQNLFQFPTVDSAKVLDVLKSNYLAGRITCDESNYLKNGGNPEFSGRTYLNTRKFVKENEEKWGGIPKQFDDFVLENLLENELEKPEIFWRTEYANAPIRVAEQLIYTIFHYYRWEPIILDQNLLECRKFPVFMNYGTRAVEDLLNTPQKYHIYFANYAGYSPPNPTEWLDTFREILLGKGKFADLQGRAKK